MNFTISKPNFSNEDLARVDSRFLPFINGWSVSETYDNKPVIIPDIVPFNYYEVTDKPANDIKDNEKELSLWCGWAGRSNGKDIDGLYDAEVIINLRIAGEDVLNANAKKVSAEIIKSGGAPMQVNFNGKFVTDFTSQFWFTKVPNGYQTVDDMNNL